MENSDFLEISVISFSSPDEYRRRPLFRADVTVPSEKPRKILGSYRFEQAVPCGVSGCAQTHDHGYVVQVDDVTETNTGWDCGLDHFGFEFLGMRQQYDRAERESSQRLALRDWIGEAARFRELIQELQLRPLGGTWLLRNLRRFDELYPAELLDILRRHADKGEVGVFDVPRDAPSDPGSINIDVEVGHVPRSRQPYATVRGLRIFSIDTDRWPFYELELELEEFSNLDAHKIPFREVARWVVWAESLETRLTELESLIEDGKQFFRRGNMKLLYYLIQDSKARELLSWIVFDSDFPENRKRAVQKKKSFWQRNLERLLQAMNQ